MLLRPLLLAVAAQHATATPLQPSYSTSASKAYTCAEAKEHDEIIFDCGGEFISKARPRRRLTPPHAAARRHTPPHAAVRADSHRSHATIHHAVNPAPKNRACACAPAMQVSFASYGTPTGHCGDSNSADFRSTSSCHAMKSEVWLARPAPLTSHHTPHRRPPPTRPPPAARRTPRAARLAPHASRRTTADRARGKVPGADHVHVRRQR